MDDALRFYDELADQYDLIFNDWTEAVMRQADVLVPLFKSNGVQFGANILDCACGIGTQAYGLASHGFAVTATDLSPRSIERALAAGIHFEAKPRFGTADFRTLAADVDSEFDLVMAFDNAIPHLLTDEELTTACQNFWLKVRPDGLFAASIRDYDALRLDPVAVTPAQVFSGPHGRRVVLQLWDWTQDLERYDVTLLMTIEAADAWQTSAYRTTYRALCRATLTQALTDAGFTEVAWYMPVETGFYQPIVIAKRPA